MNFSDQNLSVVRRCRRWRRCCCRKVLTFSSSSPEPLGQFHPNLAQASLDKGLRFKFVHMKGPDLFQGEIITKKQNNIDEISNISSQDPLGQFQPNLTQCNLG